MAIQEDRTDYEKRSQNELELQGKIEEINGNYARNDNGQGCSEAFQYIVGVLDHQRNDQSTACLQDN